jgi:hypothetical protein
MANWKFYLDGNEVEEPIGWDAIEFTAIRMESHGVDQPFSTEVRFYAEGARYIKSIYDQHFINQPIAIKITSDVSYYDSSYQFDGFLNLAIYQEKNVCDTDSWEITVGIIDDNFREDFKARTDVEIDLTKTKDLNDSTINALAFRNIRMHRMPLYLTASGKNYADFTGSVGWNAVPQNQAMVSVPTYWTSSDFKEAYGSTRDSAFLQIFGFANAFSSPIFVNNQSVQRTINFKINISFQVARTGGSPSSADVYLLALVACGTSVSSVNTLHTSTLLIGQTDTVTNATYSGSFTINPGCTFHLYFEGEGFISSNSNVTIYEGYTITLSEINEGEYASTSDVLTIEQWLRRCIYVMTGSNNKLLSDTFSESGNGCEWSYALTNGIRIRNNTTEAGTQLMTSWKKTFEELDKIFCLGWAFEWTGSEWKIRVETRDYFYQNLVSQSFANVGEVVQAAKVDMLMNNIITGYTDRWKNIQIGGVYAVHTDRNYFIQNKAMNDNSSATLDLRSNIIAEGYAIEFYRRMSDITFGAATSDRPNDNETFIIWLNRSEFTVTFVEDSEYNLPSDTPGALTFAPGTVSASSNIACAVVGDVLDNRYNFAITPTRNAFRWWKWVGMFTYKTPIDITLNAPNIQYQVGQYFTNILIGILNGFDCNIFDPLIPGIYENQNINPTWLATPYKDYLLRPIEVTFSYPQSLCDFLTLSQDEQYKKVRLTSGSLVIEGFITSATNQPEDASGGTTQFTLLYSNQQSEPGGAFDEGFDDGYDNGG